MTKKQLVFELMAYHNKKNSRGMYTYVTSYGVLQMWFSKKWGYKWYKINTLPENKRFNSLRRNKNDFN